MKRKELMLGRLALPAMMMLGSYWIGLAQETQPASTTAPKLVLKEGAEVPLRFDQDVSSKTAAEGDPVMFTLAEDLNVDGIVVARAGSKATGEITNCKKAGMMGKGGELNLRLDHLTAGPNKIRLRGSRGREGDSKVGTAVALTVLFGPVGLLKHGKNIDINQGTALMAYVADDATLAPAP